MELRDQLTELRRAMKEAKERRMYERYQAVFLYLSGHKMEEVAQITGRTRKTVGGYVAAYRKGGLEALTPLRPSGRPPRLSPEQEEQLVAVVANQLPSEAGLGPFANWTLDLMIAYVKREWGVRYSQRGMSLLLERLGLSYTRPTYTLAKADPEKQRVFREETFPRLKKN